MTFRYRTNQPINSKYIEVNNQIYFRRTAVYIGSTPCQIYNKFNYFYITLLLTTTTTTINFSIL